MIGIKASRRRGGKEEAEKPFWISFSDLMTALMVLFLVAMSVALIAVAYSERTKDITEYLLQSEHRFLGALVIAVWGGEPQYTPLTMMDPDGMLTGLDGTCQ